MIAPCFSQRVRKMEYYKRENTRQKWWGHVGHWAQHHFTIILQYSQRHRAPLCPCPQERCIVNTVACKSGPFSPVKQILPFSPLISNWVQLHLSAFAQGPASCRNYSAFLTKTHSLNQLPCGPRANCLCIKQGPGGCSWNGTSHDAWKHIQVLQGEGIWQEIDTFWYLLALTKQHLTWLSVGCSQQNHICCLTCCPLASM